MQQVTDFLEESEALRTVLGSLLDADFETPTQFKGWTINNILRHLYVWNIAADLALSNEAAFGEFIAQMTAGIRGGRLPDFEAGVSGRLVRTSAARRMGRSISWHDSPFCRC